jgi:hypothetical protein
VVIFMPRPLYLQCLFEEADAPEREYLPGMDPERSSY